MQIAWFLGMVVFANFLHVLINYVFSILLFFTMYKIANIIYHW